MNLKEIKDLIELVDDKGFAEFEIKRRGFRLRISRFKESNPQIIQTTPAPIIISSPVSGGQDALQPGPPRGLIEAGSSAASSSTVPPGVESAGAQPELHIIKSPI